MGKPSVLCFYQTGALFFSPALTWASGAAFCLPLAVFGDNKFVSLFLRAINKIA